MAAPGGPTLHDIHLPPAPGWWPPAPGWWLLALVAVALFSVMVWWWLRYRRRRRLWRQVESELHRLSQGPADDVLAGVSQLMRRVARCTDATAAVAGGDAWRALVQRHAGGRDEMRVLEALPDVLYRPGGSVDVEQLLPVVRRWLRRALRGGPRHA